MRIAVIGAGALGLYYGSLLQRAGNDVHFLLRSDYAAIMEKGLTVYSIDGDYHLPKIQGYRSSERIGRADLVLIGLKTFANDRFEELVGPLVGQETRILTLQNGLGNEEALAALFGEDRIYGGVAFLCSNRGAPGIVHHLGEGRVVIGKHLRGTDTGTEDIATLFRAAGIECRVTSDLKRARWEKLVWNIPFNGISALTMQPVDKILELGVSRHLVLQMMSEVIEAGNAQGLIKDIPSSLAENMVNFTENLGSYRPSMLIDRQEGRPLELGAIFAAPLNAAAERHVRMPRVEELYALLQLAETVK